VPKRRTRNLPPGAAEAPKAEGAQGRRRKAGRPPSPPREPRKRREEGAAQVQKLVPRAVCHIQASFTTRSSRSPTRARDPLLGLVRTIGYKGRASRRVSPAQKAAEACAEKAAKFGVRELEVKIKGPGAGREAPFGPFSSGLDVRAIEDVTPLPHNGCGPEKRESVACESPRAEVPDLRRVGSSSSSRAPGCDSAKWPMEKESRPRPARRQARPDDRLRESTSARSSAPSGCTACSSASSARYTGGRKQPGNTGDHLVQALERRSTTWCTACASRCRATRAPAPPGTATPRQRKESDHPTSSPSTPGTSSRPRSGESQKQVKDSSRFAGPRASSWLR